MKLVTFHYRHHKKINKSESEIKQEKLYFKKLNDNNINLQEDDKGIQRRLDIKRIKEIEDYYKKSKDTLFPTSVILSTDLEDEVLGKYINNEIGYFDLNDFTVKFRIIDGQHRLGGLIFAEENNIDLNLSIPVILIINTTVPKEAELFSIINGKQKTVNKSLIYDLQSEIGEKETDNIYKYHTLCKTFNNEKNSPLYKQIKLLGNGTGAISQAFFIDSLTESLKSYHYLNLMEMQNLFNILYYYIKSYQQTFPEDWPVPENINNLEKVDLEEYSKSILSTRKSQLVKTNGYGALIKAFPHICREIISNRLEVNLLLKLENMKGDDLKNNFKKGSSTEIKTLLQNKIISIFKTITIQDFLFIVSKLKGKIDWTKVNGTGKSAQKDFYEDIIDFSEIRTNKNMDNILKLVVEEKIK